MTRENQLEQLNYSCYQGEEHNRMEEKKYDFEPQCLKNRNCIDNKEPKR